MVVRRWEGAGIGEILVKVYKFPMISKFWVSKCIA